MEKRSIALDGPAGAGKSTLARRTAKRLGFIYVDTGALYRSIGLLAMRRGIASTDEKGVTSMLSDVSLEMRYDDNGMQRMILNGEDVTDDIRMPEASKYASDVSAMVPVRAFLLSMQRDMAKRYDVVMDGRDIGTVVLPDAGVKVFLTADPKARAMRRYMELREKNVDTTPEDVLREMMSRDKNDSERAAAPLKAASDAVVLDTTELSIEDSLEKLCGIIKEKLSL